MMMDTAAAEVQDIGELGRAVVGKCRGVSSTQGAGLEAALGRRDWYEASQVIKAVASRCMLRKKPVARDILLSAALLFATSGQHNTATELGNLFINSLITAKEAPTQNTLDAIIQVSLQYKVEHIEAARILLKTALKWSSSSADYKYGYCGFHGVLARLEKAAQNYAVAQNHFIHSAAPAEFTEMLQQWATTVLEGERDMLLARAVFLLLGVSKPLEACTVFYLYHNCTPASITPEIAAKPFPHFEHTTPLTHFTWFITCACHFAPQSPSSKRIFLALNQSYSKSISRDPVFPLLIESIGKQYFGVQPTSNTSSGGMASLFDGLFRSLGAAPSS
ncbi:CGI-20 protein [Pelomyxa schiedti]|nr:CGI-20 protein [Pelomyxa schiedti]